MGFAKLSDLVSDKALDAAHPLAYLMPISQGRPPVTSTSDKTAVIARMTPSWARRTVGTGIIAALGVLFLAMAVLQASGVTSLMLTLLAMGSVAIWLAVRLWQSTAIGLELTREELRTTSGQVLIRVDEIKSVDRGVFAIKPASGFTIVTRSAGPRHWAPGLWWRAGKRIGIGGVTHRNEGRFMAELLSDMIAGKVKG